MNYPYNCHSDVRRNKITNVIGLFLQSHDLEYPINILLP